MLWLNFMAVCHEISRRLTPGLTLHGFLTVARFQRVTDKSDLNPGWIAQSQWSS